MTTVKITIHNFITKDGNLYDHARVLRIEGARILGQTVPLYRLNPEQRRIAKRAP